MNAHFTSHLTEEALDDVLIGLASIEQEAHVAVCSLCQAKVHAFRSDVNSFNRTTLAWSRSKAESLPPIRPAARKAAWAYLAPAEWALAAAVLLFIALPVWNPHSPLPFSQVESPTAQASAPDSATQIAADNQLLESVDAALSANDDSAVSAYGLPDESEGQSRNMPNFRPRYRPKSRMQ